MCFTVVKEIKSQKSTVHEIVKYDCTNIDLGSYDLEFSWWIIMINSHVADSDW